MKRTHICPKCDGRRIWVVEPFRVPSETARGAVLSVVPHQEDAKAGFFGMSRVNSVGRLDLYVCAGCGYSELYALDFENLRADNQTGVRLLDASSAPAGPFR
jgi:hypothetical protein